MSDVLKSATDQLPQTPTTFTKVPSSSIKSAPVKSYRDDEKFDVSVELDCSQALLIKLDGAQSVDDCKEASVEPQASDNESELIMNTEQVSEEDAEVLENENEIDSDAQYIAAIDPDFYSSELDSALANVRELASFHQESFVNSLCDTFAHMNGKEASINDLAAIFNRVRATFAEEAIEEELEMDQESDSDEEADSDYDPNSIRDRQQIQQDLEDDAFSSLELDSEDEDVSDADDLDYDPTDAGDVEQVLLDEVDDFAESEEESELSEIETAPTELEEDAIINLESFDADYFAAIQCAQNAAKLSAAQIIKNIKSEFDGEYGDEQVSGVIDKVFAGIDLAQNEEIVESESEVEEEEEELENDEESVEEVDVSVFEQEMYYALDNVRKLAKHDQSSFVDQICDVYQLYNGFEPSIDELSDIFAGIKQEFADEAAEEILEDVDEEIGAEDESENEQLNNEDEEEQDEESDE